MAEFQFKCSQCGQTLEADDSLHGQVAECSYCGKEIVVPHVKPKLGIVRNTDVERGMEPSSNTMKQPLCSDSTPRERVAIPERLVYPTQDISGKMHTQHWKRKMLIALSVFMAIAIIGGVISYGVHLYFGDRPRLERGIANYKKNVYPQAYKLLLPLAKKGYATAQLYVGDCYAKGNGVVKNPEEAVQWYRKAAEAGNVQGQSRLALCYFRGDGVEMNAIKGEKLLEAAAAQSWADGVLGLASCQATMTAHGRPCEVTVTRSLRIIASCISVMRFLKSSIVAFIVNLQHVHLNCAYYSIN